MYDVLEEIYAVIESRKQNAAENSYTAYLFREGIDKILKKIGEEASETIIAAKSLEAARTEELQEKRVDLVNEAADLLYHLLVLFSERGIGLGELAAVLEERAGKSGNLKPIKNSDKNA